MGTGQEARRGWVGGVGAGGSLQPSALFPCPTPAGLPCSLSRVPPLLPFFPWTSLAQMPPGVQPLKRGREG